MVETLEASEGPQTNQPIVGERGDVGLQGQHETRYIDLLGMFLSSFSLEKRISSKPKIDPETSS